MNADTNTAAPASATQPQREPSPGPTPKADKARKAAKKSAPKKAAPKRKTSTLKGKSTDALVAAAKTYHRDAKVKTPKGSVSVDCNDKIAKDLRGKDLDEVYKIAARTLREPEADLRKQYKHLNVGMQRMNLGNRIRAAN